MEKAITVFVILIAIGIAIFLINKRRQEKSIVSQTLDDFGHAEQVVSFESLVVTAELTSMAREEISYLHESGIDATHPKFVASTRRLVECSQAARKFGIEIKGDVGARTQQLLAQRAELLENSKAA